MNQRTLAFAAGGAALVGVLLLLGTQCTGGKKKKKRQAALNGGRISLQLTKVRILNHNSRVFTFALPGKEQVLGLPVGKHVSLSYKDPQGRLVTRAYTPVTNDETHVGVVELAVKIYPAGKMTQYLERMSIYQSLTFAGPKGEFEYLGRGEVKMEKKDFPPRIKVKSFAMLAGGSGITPIYQVMEAIVRDPSDTTEVHLIYANQSEEDILLRDEVEALQRAKPSQISIWYTLDKPPSDWQQGAGFITADMMTQHLGPKEDAMALMCGPPPMLKFACLPNLE
eukprot:gene2696-4190_t